MCWAAQPSLQLVDRRLIRNYIDFATTVERPERDKSRQTSAIRKGSIVEFELAWAPHLLSTMDYTYRERHGEAIYRLKHGMPLEPRSTLRHMGTGLASGIVGC
jgi:hypothetical protein